MYFKDLAVSNSVVVPKGLGGGGEIVHTGAGGNVTITAQNSTIGDQQNDSVQLAAGEKLTIPSGADFTGSIIATDGTATASVRLFGIFGTRPKQGPRCK